MQSTKKKAVKKQVRNAVAKTLASGKKKKDKSKGGGRRNARTNRQLHRPAKQVASAAPCYVLPIATLRAGDFYEPATIMVQAVLAVSKMHIEQLKDSGNKVIDLHDKEIVSILKWFEKEYPKRFKQQVNGKAYSTKTALYITQSREWRKVMHSNLQRLVKLTPYMWS